MASKTLLSLVGLSTAALLAIGLGLRTPDVEVIKKASSQPLFAPAWYISPGRTKVIDHRKKSLQNPKVWVDATIYEDVNGNGTLDRVTTIYCSERPRSFGLDKDCTSDEIELLNNSYPGGYGALRRGGSTYSEVGKYSSSGQQLQSEFERLLEEYGK